MNLWIGSEGDQRALAERIARAPFKRPFMVRADFRDGRSNEQNRKLWATLRDISQQVEWFGERLSPEDWKTVFTASLRQQRAVPGIDGGLVMLGMSTSKMSKSEFSELIELIHLFGTERGVEFSEVTRES